MCCRVHFCQSDTDTDVLQQSYTNNVLQNASLSVMTQNQIWSMHSTDSLWGDEDSVVPLDEDAPQPPETWLMLEFCDRGSLLVCHLLARALLV